MIEFINVIRDIAQTSIESIASIINYVIKLPVFVKDQFYFMTYNNELNKIYFILVSLFIVIFFGYMISLILKLVKG